MTGSGSNFEIKSVLEDGGGNEERRPLLEDGEGGGFSSRGRYGTIPGGGKSLVTVPTGEINGKGAEPRNFFESLDYEPVESSLYSTHWQTRGKWAHRQHVLLKWVFALVIGVSTGATAFLINMAVENIGGLKFGVVLQKIRNQEILPGFLILATTNMLLVGVAATLCQLVSIEAAGSGIPEVKAYLNGVDTPRIFAPKTLLVKVLGSIGSVAGGLPVGKEGPLVHTGACIANIVGQGGSRRFHLTASWLRLFKNDRDRRDLVTCGAAAGVAAAFRAPIGGVLMALEEVTSWWRSSLLWRVFFTNAVVAVTVQTLISACESGKCGMFSDRGFIIFDSSEARVNFGLLELLPVLVLGVTGGVLGSLFNHLNLALNRWRRERLPKSKIFRIMEACLIALLTAALRYGVPFLAPCTKCPDSTPSSKTALCGSDSGNYETFFCPKGSYNDLAGLLFVTNDNTVKNLFSTGTSDLFSYRSLLIFFLTFYPNSILTYGITVPSGLFVPSIISGATYGRAVGMFMVKSFGRHRVGEGTYALLGAASFLGGSMRMTVSIAVILLELTGTLRLLPLIMLTLLVSKGVGDAVNDGIYDAHIRFKGIPFLEARPEVFMRYLRARDAVSCEPVVLRGVEKVGNIVKILRDTPHNAYPVMEETQIQEDSDSNEVRNSATNSEVKLAGMVLRRHLLVLLKLKKTFQFSPSSGSPIDLGIPFEEFGKPGSGKGLRLEDIEISADDAEKFLDIRPFVNRSHYFVSEDMSLSKVYSLFRQLGLRHLCVVPKPCEVIGVLTRKDLLPESFGERRVLKRSTSVDSPLSP